MPKTVVDFLEAVEIEQHHRGVAVRREASIQALVEKSTVGEAGQLIVMGQLEQFGVAGAPLADVADERSHPDPAGLLPERHREFDGERAAIAMKGHQLDGAASEM